VECGLLEGNADCDGGACNTNGGRSNRQRQRRRGGDGRSTQKRLDSADRAIIVVLVIATRLCRARRAASRYGGGHRGRFADPQTMDMAKRQR